MRGNRIAAVGMAIAVVATLLNPSEGEWGLIVLGIALGTAVGVPAARQVKMTAMPQMVALFNGVGGGAVFLIAWAEFRRHGSTYGDHTIHIIGNLGTLTISGGAVATYIAVFSVFAAIVGSISFWGSNIAFGKLQEIIPGRPITLGAGQQVVNLVLLGAGARGRRRPLRRRALRSALHRHARLRGAARQLPRAADRRRRHAGRDLAAERLHRASSAAATGIALNNPALIVAGMIVGASGTILTNLMAVAMNRSIPAIVRGRLRRRRRDRGRRRGRRARRHDQVDRRAGRGDPARLREQGRDRARATGMAVAQAQHAVRELTKELEKRGVEVHVRDPPGRRAHAGPHERAAGRGRRALRPAQGDGGRQLRVPAHRRLAGDRRQRRHQPGGEEHALLADLRHADPRGQREPAR